MSDMTVEKAQALLDGARWHYMDEVTVAAYGPWVRAKDYDAQAAELTRLRAQEAKLAALLNRAREELYMIRMKDSGAVYDVTLRMDLADALSAYEGEKE